MHVLYVCRLFSGLHGSVLSGRWAPTGAPAIGRMIEALDAGSIRATIVFTNKDGDRDNVARWHASRDVELRLDGLETPVLVLAGEDRFPHWLGGLRRHLRELRQLRRLWSIARRVRPDVVVMDHGNIWAAALMARFGRWPVVIRIMGVYPVMRAALTSRRPALRFQRWCYRAPFAAAIAPIDGSGCEVWLERAVADSVPRHLMVNGVARLPDGIRPDRRLAALPADKVKILFIGKLERFKGCDTFVAAMLALPKDAAARAHAVIIGRGTMSDALHQRVAAAGACDRVTFIADLPHAQAMLAQRLCDVYVSLNHYGNLSNTNLEAIAAGACVVTPRARCQIDVDVATERLVPEDAVLRIPAPDDAPALTEALTTLIRDPDRRAKLRARLGETGRGLIEDWDARIARELDILREAARARA